MHETNDLSPMMVNLPAPPPQHYPIWIQTHHLTDVALWMPSSVSIVAIITDETVKNHYGVLLEDALQHAGFKTFTLTIPPGEASKTRRQKAQLEKALLNKNCDRQTLIIALGGGVVGDLAGFVAATYLRGVRLIQIPTTLLAMIDSAVGGKTAIDTPQGKNMIGAFWQPIAVVSDVACLNTLSQTQRINGLLEAVKMFLTDDAQSFYWFQQHLETILAGDATHHIEVIKRAVAIKVKTVCADEKESGRRSVLNFGHTIGHALEILSDYTLLHGYAVGLGMLVEARIALDLNLLSYTDYESIKRLLSDLQINGDALDTFDVDAVIRATLHDKKCQHGEVHYVLIAGVGQVFIEDAAFTHKVAASIVRTAFQRVIGEAHGGQ